MGVWIALSTKTFYNHFKDKYDLMLYIVNAVTEQLHAKMKLCEYSFHDYVLDGVAPLLKRLEKQGLVSRIRPEYNERKLYISLTKEGEELKYKAVHVPQAMRKCINLSDDELIMLRTLLDKALASMEVEKGEEK